MNEINLEILKRLADHSASSGPFSFIRKDGDAYIYDEDGKSIMSDMQFYPWVPSESTMEFMAAASPVIFRILIRALEMASARLDAEYPEEKDPAIQQFISAAAKELDGR